MNELAPTSFRKPSMQFREELIVRRMQKPCKFCIRAEGVRFQGKRSATSGPRMHWLRLRPESPSELDRIDWRGKWIGEDDESYVGEEDETEYDSQMEDFDSVG